MSARTLTHDEKVMKRAFKRACELAGNATEMANLLGMPKQVGQITKWSSPDYPDVLPTRLINVVDRIAGYPVMKEALCGVDGYEVRAITAEDPDMPVCSAVAGAAGEGGRAMQVALEAVSDGIVSPREAECVENAARKAMQFFQQIIDGVHALVPGNSQPSAPTGRMVGGERQ